MLDLHGPRRGHRVVGPVPQHQEERHFTLAVIGVVLTVASTAIQFFAAQQQAEAQRSAAKAQQKLFAQQAQSEREQAEFEERQARRRNRLLLGKQTAELADLGLDISSGSPLLLQLDSAKQAEIDALNVRRVGATAASASEFEVAQARRRAALAQESGRAAGGAALVGGAASILRQFVAAGQGSGQSQVVKPDQFGVSRLGP